MAWCNPIGNLRRVSLCTRRYHGTRPRCHGYTTNVRAHLSCERTPSNASNAPCPNTTTTMALFLRQVSRSCWKNREDDRLPSGIRAPLFFFFYRLLQLHNLLLLFCGFALETFQKTRVIFFSGGFLSFADIFLPSPPDFNNKQRPQRETKVSSRSFPSNMALTHDSLDERPFRSPLSSKK